MDITLDGGMVETKDEYSIKFLQGMLNRMFVSFFKYGKVRQAYPSKVNAIDSLRLRLHKYEVTGNTEYLMDVANFAMIEFMYPAHPQAHFEATDSDKSPGRVWKGESKASKRGNLDD